MRPGGRTGLRRMVWGFILWNACGGGGSTLPGSQDLGIPNDPGQGPDTVSCQVKEDCPAKPCHLAVCLGGACDYQVVPQGAVCSDPQACIPSGTCDANGVCQGEWACEDDNPCTRDQCEDARCVHIPLQSGPCDDGDPCSEGDRCVAGRCQPGSLVCECEGDSDCPLPTDLCLGRLRCDPVQKRCVPDANALVTCPAHDNPCRRNDCDPKTGQCKEIVLPNGSQCDLGACHVNESCQNGECVGQEKCPSIGCVKGICNENTGECTTENASDGTGCDDGNPCSTDDQCVAGVCKGSLPQEVCNGKDDDCDGYTDPENADGCVKYYFDSDKDGAGDPAKSKCLCGPAGLYAAPSGNDCNDTDPKFSPAVQEVCNGEDDDCDGQTDEVGAAGCAIYYQDLDGDGFGATGNSKCLCVPESPYWTLTSGDCNDLDASVRPGVSEVCNEVDDDCNGSTDEGENNLGCSTFWVDADGDGSGGLGSKCLCHPKVPYTATNQNDCMDNDKDVHPGATEVCNGKDDDCNGDTDGGENLGGCQSYYMDPDGDGYGSGVPKCYCKPQGSYVTLVGGDCNASDPTIHPGGKVCGKDGDCDGLLLDGGEACDDGNTTTWDGCDSQCAILEFQVNSYSLGDQKNPDAAFPGPVGDSGFFIAWEGIGCSQWSVFPPQCVQVEDGVWVNRYDASGQVIRVEIANTYYPGNQRNPAVAGSSNGAVVVWDGPGSDTETSEIYVRRFNLDGTAKENFVTRVNGVTSGTQRYPDVVADNNLAFRAVWETVSTGGDSDIALRAFTQTLTGWPEMTVNTSTSNQQTRPRIAAFDAGTRFVVVWESSAQAGQEDVYARRFLWNTTALDAAESRANAYLSGSQREPAVAGSPVSGGGFVVVWAGVGSGSSDDDIFARVFKSDGSPLTSSEVRVNTTTSGAQVSPDVAMAADGSFVVVWQSGGDVYLRRFHADQTALGGEIRANLYTFMAQSNPAITGASNGIVLIAWDSQSQDTSGLGVFAQRFGPKDERLFR